MPPAVPSTYRIANRRPAGFVSPYDSLMRTGVQSFSPELASIPAARRFLRELLYEWDADQWEWNAGQVLTELATNAVIHAHTEFDVEVTFTEPTLKICVSDGSPRLPVQRQHSDQATTGRGLAVVQTVAQSWGTEMRPDGKTVWCVILAEGHEDRQVSFDLEAFHLEDADPLASDAGASASPTQLRAA